MKVSITNTSLLKKIFISMIVLFGLWLWQTPVVATVTPILPVLLIAVLTVFFLIPPSLRLLLRQLRQVYPDSVAILLPARLKTAVLAVATLAAISGTSTEVAAQCSGFAVIVGEWSNASLQRFDGTTGAYQNQLATGIGTRINSVLQYPPPNGNLFLGGYEEVNVVNAFTGAVQFSFSGGPFSGLTEQIVVGLDGNAYVANEGTGAGFGSIAKYNATTGAYISTFISFPSYQPNGLAQDASGNWYIGTRNSPNTVLKYNSSGVFQGTVTTLAGGNAGGGLSIYNNELYVVNTGGTQVVNVYSLPVTSFPATPVRTLNTGGSAFVGIAFGPDNNMYMADFFNGRVTVFNPTTGALIRTLTNASIPTPHGIGFTPCAPVATCAISAVSATPTPCPGSSNTYTVNGAVTFTNAPTTGTLTVSVQGGGSQVFTAPFTSPMSYTIGGLIADGVNRTVTASFSASSCAGSTSYMAPSSSAGTFNFPLNSVLGNVNYDASPTAGQFIFNLFVPANPSPQSWTLEAFDVDFTPQGATNQATFCLEWQEDFDANSNYQNYTVIPLENMTRGHAGEAGTASINIPAGGIGLVRAGMVRYLFDQYYKGTAIGSWSNDEAAAFQLALWEVSHEVYTSNNSFSVTTPSVNGFYTTMSSPAVTLGQTYVSAINTLNWTDAQWKSYASTTWHVIPLENHQSMGVSYQDVITAVPKLPLVCNCTVPTALTFTQVAPTCTAGVANNNGTISLSAQTNGTHYGVSSLGAATYNGPAFAAATAIPGSLPAVIKSNVPNSGGTYIVRIFNGSNGCYTDQTVTVAPVCCLNVTSATPLCHGNGTPELATDDYITFSINITNPLAASQYFTVTGTQAGNPIAITLSNGSPATAVNCGLNTPLRTPVGTAGHGAITLTITDNHFGCSTTIMIADPGSCAVSCTPGTPTMVMYNYETQIDITELNNLPIIIPKFDQLGGTRTLTSVKLDYSVGATTIAVMENKAAQAQNFKVDFLTDAFIDLNGGTIASPSLKTSMPLTALGVGILVPAQGEWPGDALPALPAPQVPSTIQGMSPWLSDDKLQFGKDPRTDPRWVTNATGNPATDDDMIFFPATTDVKSGTINYSAPVDLANFIGTGNVPLVVSTLSGFSSAGGGGNVDMMQRTRAFATAKVTYTYECLAACTAPTLSAVPTPVGCFGASTGAINLTVTGGTPAPFTYAWSNMANTEDISGLAAGTYTVTVTTASGGCTATTSVIVTGPASAVAVTSVPTNSTSCVSPNGAINITATGGTSGYTYDWADIAGTSNVEDRTGLGAGTYTVTVTDANGCTTSTSNIITAPGSPTVTQTVTNILCFGAATGAINITAAGGTGAYTYDWNDIAGTSNPEDRTLLAAGTYTVTVTDAASCTVSASIPVTQPASAVAVAVTTKTDILCFGASTGAINITASGGTGAYTYDWADVAGTNNTEDRTALAAGTYTVTVSDANGCTTSVSAILTQPATAVSVTSAPTNITCFGASTGAINIPAAGGTGAYTYDWNDIAGTSNPEDRTAIAAGTYTVTVTDANGCTTSTSVTLTQPAAGVSIASAPTNSTSCAAPNGAINITATGGTPGYTYDWADIAGTTNAEDRTALGAGTYTVTVTDANGCTSSTSTIITAPSSPTVTQAVTNVLCFGAATGAINITAAGGTGAYTYDWADILGTSNPEDRTLLTAGTYTVTITDAASCTVSASIPVTQPASAVAVVVTTQTNILCFGASTGAINITATGGTGAYTYDWADVAGTSNTEDRTAIAAGTYTVTVTDANGCTTSVSAILTQPATAVSVTAAPTNILCFGASTGAINITAAGGTGAYTYDWNDIAGTSNPEDRTAIAAGTYTVTVTDANGCTTSTSVTLTQPAAGVSVTGVVTNSTNCVAPNGAINITAAGGTPGYTYDWGDIAGVNNPEDRTALSPAVYGVTVTDANGCTATNSFTIAPPPSPVFSANSVTNVLCFGQSTGAINVTLTGGIAPYTYDWADLAGTNNGEDRTNIPAGTYTVTATDNVGCTASTSAIVTQPATAVSAVLNSVTTADCVTATIDITPSGGTPGYTYAWSNGQNVQDASVTAPGTYTVTVTDANGCTVTTSATYGGCDKGDLPDPSYATLNANNGPSHIVVSGIKIGATVDAETNGQPNTPATGDGVDEDGFIPANVMFVAGQTTTLNIPVMNMNAAAKLTIYFDWNKDGLLTGTNEMYTANVALNATTVTLPVAVPVSAVLNMNLGMRIRLTTSTTMSPTGFAPDGEIEDYLIQVMGFDYGDLPDSGAGTGTGNYETQSANNGPSHKIITDPTTGAVTLKIGATVDAEGNGQQSTLANGDDSTTAPGTDDEQGYDPAAVMFVTGNPTVVTIPVMNMTGGDAKLVLYTDWNKDGDFADANEMWSTTVVNNATTATVTVTPPLTAVLNMDLGVRIRISNDPTFIANMSPDGPVTGGEVEDYIDQVMGFDYGDLNDTGAGTGTAAFGTAANHNTLATDNGASHKITTDPVTGAVTLKIGASVDDEATGQPSANAGRLGGGDDAVETPDDEDGLTYGAIPNFIVTQTTTLTIPVMNMTGSDAKLVAWIDFNKDGDFLDAGEMVFTTVTNGATTATLNIPVPLPPAAAVGEYVGLRLRLAAATEPMVSVGPLNSGEVEDYEVQLIGFDYGDLPETYNTSGNDNPPAHIVSTNLKLGASVDAELDGAPEAMAGAMTGGDDNTAGLVTFGTSTPAGDDENGVTFLTPMVPGSSACISVTAMNMNPTAAVLQMWVDFNGDGDMLDAGEAVTSGAFNGAGGGAAVTANTGLTNAQLCFDVPVGATFAPGGAAFVRFRLSPAGGLQPNSQTGTIPFGEIEDYKVQLGKVGNLVWEDRNFNGTQDAGEPGIDGVTVSLTWLGADGVLGGTDDVTYPTTATANGGKYYFCGLADGPGATDNNFKLTYTTPATMTPTRPNAGSQANGGLTDADATITGMDLTMAMETFAFTIPTPTAENSTGDAGTAGVGNFPDNVTDETHDMGFAFLDYGDLPQTGNGDQFSTLMANNGAVHVIVPGFKLGASVDSERDGQPTATADGDDGDEDGVTFTSPLIPGNNATISVVSMNPLASAAVLQGWIDWNNNGLLDATEALAFTSSVIPTGNATTTFTFPVPATAIFNDGMVFARFRLSPTGGLTANGPDKYNTATTVPQGEVEDYKMNVAKVGNLVWEDRNFNGVQDAPAGEPGINGVTVTLQWAGADNNIGTGDDVTYAPLTTGTGFDQGEYYYCGLVPGTYKIIYTSPANMTPTRPNVGSQVNGGTLDADGVITGMDLTMAMETFTIASVTTLPLAENGNGDNGTTSTGTFPDAQVDETHDMGFAFLDYGDLPQSGNGDAFSTQMANNGAVHVIVPGFKLGASVDGERDGTPGANADGDDLSNTGAADDEDGVTFTSPLIPGYNATISVVSMNPLGAAAVLQGWIDWNNNGLLDAAEALAFTSSVIPTGNATTTFTFPVPATAIFNDGMVFARFRLSPTGGLTANGPDKYGATPVPQGEVEDYKKNVMKVGNIVWEDYDFDGTQDATEPGIGGTTVQLVWGGPDGNTTTTADNVTYTTTTLSAAAGGNIVGEYNFCGLIEGQYKIVALTPSDMTPTTANAAAAGDVKDSDGNVTADITMTMTDPFTVTLAQITTQPTGENGLGDNAPGVLGTFPDNQTNETFDFGFVSVDFGDLPDTYVTDDTPDNSGAQHITQPGKYLGTCVDAERNANIDPAGTAGTWSSGDDFATSTRTQGTCTVVGDDENGVQFITPLIAGYEACARITYTAIDVPGLVRTGNTYLSAWIDYNGDGDFLDAGEKAVSDLALTTGTGVIRDVCFNVPGTATFNGGAVRARFRIHCQPGLGSAGLAIGGEVEDYYIPVAKSGNYAWFDNDLRGDQMTTNSPVTFQPEAGINGAEMVMVWGGLDGNLATTNDNRVYRKTTATGTQGENQNGIYYFCGLIEGQYRIVPRKYAAVMTGTGIDTLNLAQPELAIPVRKILTVANNTAANDYKDSDGTPATTFAIPNLLASPTATVGTLAENSLGDIPTVYNYPDRLTNLGLDFGYVQEPNIELNQKIAGVEKGLQCGQFKVIVDLCIQNSGGADNGYVMAVPLNNIQAQVPLQQQLGAAFLMTMGAPQIMNGTWECGTAALPQTLPTVNPNFNGTTDVNMFNGTSGLLYPGEKVVVRYVFEVKPSNIPEPASLNLLFQASGSGKAVNYQGQPIPNYFNNGAQYMAMDLSNNDLVFNGTYNDPDQANSIGNCWKTTQAMAANDLVQVSVDENCEALILDEMILEGEDEDCTDNQFCLGGYYKVTIRTMVTNQPVPNPVPSSYIGQTLIAQVENIVSCNKVWGKIKIEDKLPPVVTCETIEIACAETNYDAAYLANTLGITAAYPTVTENCSAYTQSYTDEWHDLPCPSTPTPNAITAYIIRTWVVTDASGNSATCNQTINIIGSRVYDVNFPADAVIPCGAGVNTNPAITGTPYITFDYPGGDRDYSIWPGSNYCELQATYVDQILPVCDGTYKILRTWTVYDWCVPTSPFPPTNNPQYYVQVVKVVDENGPSFTCPQDMTVSTDAFNCCASPNLPEVVMSDGCSRINHVSARILVYDQYTGALTNTLDIPGYLTSFPGNNLWNPDTLANFDITPCLPIGTHTVIYSATDDCGNHSTCSFDLTVEDLTPPTAVCDEWTKVALGVDGMAFVNAETFDDGSYDNCSQVYFKVRRMDANACQPNGSFLPQVKFCCSDIGDTVRVILRVYDVNAGTGNVGLEDFEGHYNDCMVQALVEDKIKPVCTAPANVTVSCESFDPSYWAYGQATAADNCCVDTIKQTVVLTNFDSLCNKGTITRRWTALDCAGNSSQCSQRIIVTYNQNYYVKFPADKLISTCDGTGNYGAPEFYGEDCELLATSFVDEIFTVVPDACFKIERTWTVINWCTYNPNAGCTYVPNPNPSNTTNAPANLAGVTVSAPGTTILNWNPTVVKINPTDPTATNYSTFWSQNANCYQYKQIIKVFDTQDPSVVTPTSGEYCDFSNNDAQFWNDSYWWDATIQSHDLCEGDADIAITATDACSGANISFRYLLFLDLDGNGTMETVVNSVNPPGFNNVFFNNANNPNYGGGEPRQFDFRPVTQNQKWGFGLQTDAAAGNNRTAHVRWFNQQGQNAVPQLPYGTHKIKWFVEDGCGNEYISEQTLVVKDCKKPTVVCLNGLSVNLMNIQGGMVQLWASDFLQYTSDNCTPADQLKIGIRRSGTGTGFPTNPDGTAQTGVSFTCADLGTQLVELWSIDKAGNADFCETYVLIQDNMGVCGNNATIAGALKTEEAEGVEDATVELEGVSNGLPMFNTVFSQVTGDYAFSSALPYGSDYTVTPTLELDPLNGVNTYDLILISRHILGLEPLNTPYKLISADANKSGTVTTFDVVELRKLILGTYTELPNNSSWRFVDKTQTFANPNNPFAETIRENVSVAQIQQSAMSDDFVAAKIGDVDNTAVPNQLVSTDDRSAGTLLFDIEDRQVNAGETFAVTFNADQSVKGYQFTLNLNGLKAAGIENNGSVTDENFGFFTSTSLGASDAVTTSWDAPATFSGKAQFTLRFKATKSGKLSEMLSVSSRITKAEAYTGVSKYDVALRFNGKGTSTITGLGFELYQNVPNPWVSKTQIGFHLPEAATATLTIYDVTGRTLYTTKGNFAKGYNTFSVDRKLVETVGNLYYKVETSTDSGVKQMIEMK